MTKTLFTCPEHTDCQIEFEMASITDLDSPELVAPAWAQEWVNNQLGFRLVAISHHETLPQPDKSLSEAVYLERTYRRDSVDSLQAIQAVLELRIYRRFWFQLWRRRKP